MPTKIRRNATKRTRKALRAALKAMGRTKRPTVNPETEETNQ